MAAKPLPNLYFVTDVNYDNLDSNAEVLLDVQVEGMLHILRDFGWNVDTVTKKFGSSKEGRNDDKVIDYAKNNRHCIVVTQDQGLISRCKALEIKCIGLQIDDLAKIVDRLLRKDSI